jgi:bifunctional non-homologous end joining protein LigD
MNGSQRFLYSQHLTGDALAVQANALRNEGIVSKRVDSAYRSGRNETWIKTICQKRNTFTVVAFVPASAGSITTLYLGRSEGRGLVYAGKAGAGSRRRVV